MTNDTKPHTPDAPDESTLGEGEKQTAEPAKVGFGAFSDKYRARWAANHPKMDRDFPKAGEPETSRAPDATTPAAPSYESPVVRSPEQ